MPKKAGFVAILGNPNVGKSTLINTLIGANISIVSSKPQTTRKEIVGILTKETYQIVFLDTPGIIIPRYKLQEMMMSYIPQSIASADLILMIFDFDKQNRNEFFPEQYEELFKNITTPKFAVLNKIDLAKNKSYIIPVLNRINQINEFNEIIPISALKGENLDELENTVVSYLPEHEFYYDADSISTLNEKFFAAEIIRQVLFNKLSQELPYSTEVQIEEFKERQKGKWFINASIICERPTQKQIIIGSNGEMIKEIGTTARKEIEDFLGVPIFLELFVKVRENWRDNPTYLKSFGY
ncbi:MAG TPA: GTPase Era [Bacteroidota bacterium]|nr:GTPase Era [Candidatus Kapabacteria bacterium]HRS00940.1 GTPase Era [Bacteroidota bacterium]